MHSMASASSSSVQKSFFKYDVFLSFRGEDTRKNFVDHLYHALQQKSINTYKDDEKIKKGNRISDELIGSIKDSKFYIIVFSKNYVSSSWCLDELVKIMECQKAVEHTAYPVFYDVEPTEVRKQIGAVGEAFAKHNEEDAGKWREALREAAGLAGWELKNTLDGHESKFIQKIVEEISLELRFINSSVDAKLVGMKTRVKDLVSSLETSSDDVSFIGIKGMGGSGKTTLARAVFDEICIWFEGQSFVENVREVSKDSLSGLKKLQKQILSDVLNDQSIRISSVYSGTNILKRMMCNRKVLLVLDDVDRIEQLEALACDPNWFKSGSKIIITTRDEQVLTAHKVNFVHDVNLLSHEEATCLFSRYAFGREIPIRGFEELSRKFVHYAAGLPLTIKVLGSFLCGKTEHEWVDAIERLNTVPLKQTLEKLELSYNGLDNDQKEIFLDVACILKGELKDEAIKRLESCGFHAQIGLRVLEQKSLITISDSDHLCLHDHVEEMGRNIVRRLHPTEPNKHSRLWIDKEIKDILVKDLGTKATRCINLRQWDLHPTIIMKGLRNMKELRYLYVNNRSFCLRKGHGDILSSGCKFDEGGQHLPSSLRFLHWHYYPFLCLPKTFEANNLVHLEMCFSNITQLWEEGKRKVLDNLKSLNLSSSKLRTLDLGLTPHLERLYLGSCNDFLELHMPVECLKLKVIDLRWSKLTNLNLELIPHLESLDLGGCSNFTKLHMPIECLKLKSLNLTRSKLRTFDLRLAPHLERLHLGGCNDFEKLYMPVKCLNLSYSLLRSFDLGLTPDLEKLDLRGCNELVELRMPVECPKLKFLYLSGSKLSNLNLGLTPHLERLDLKECYHLVDICAPVGCLKQLVYLNLSGCSRFESFLVDKQSESPHADHLHKLELIAESLDICPLHSNNTCPKFQFKCLYNEPLPTSSGNIEKLISFGLCACTNLESFSTSICGLQGLQKFTLEGSIPKAPKDLFRLESLEELTLSMKEIKHLPKSICLLKHLKSLELRSCLLLEELPDDLGRLECLEKLIVTECVHLRDIPNSICKMKCLKYLHLTRCIRVDKMPEEIGCLECLTELNIEGTGISHLPQSIYQLKSLRIVGSA